MAGEVAEAPRHSSFTDLQHDGAGHGPGYGAAMVQSFFTRRFLQATVVLAGALAMLCIWATAAPAAPIFGGLGAASKLEECVETCHVHGGVSLSSEHVFTVDYESGSEDGSYFIGEEEEEEESIRIQKFGPEGRFLAENRIAIPGSSFVEGIRGFAIDPKKERLYVLLDEETNALHTTGAAQLWSFSTKVSGEQLENQELLTTAKTLLAHSSSKPAALLEPTGISVDPATHDLLILGQQYEPKLEEQVAAVQRVHTEGPAKGELGPRYVDEEDCLVGGVLSAAEEKAKKEAEARGETIGEPCEEADAAPTAPAVSPGGRLYAEVSENGIWEIPSTEGATEAFESGAKPKEYDSQPRRLFALETEKQHVVEELSENEGGGTMSMVPGPSGTRIYVDAEINTGFNPATHSGGEKSPGVAILGYSESGATPAAQEIGWTGGQNEASGSAKCALPLGSSTPLIGSDGEEHALVFDATSETATLLRFGSGTGAEECGHAKATPPRVELGLAKEVTSVLPGKEVTLFSEVLGANAESVEWKFKNTTSGKEQAEPAGAYQFQTPTLKHKFEEPGKYEITEIVVPDDFGPNIEEHTNLTVGEAIAVGFSSTSSTAGQPTTFTTHLEDPFETSPKFKYLWKFGDGTMAEDEGGLEFAQSHTYASAGSYEVTLKATDKGGHSAEQTHTITVSAPSGGGGGGGGGSGGGGGGGGGGTTTTTTTTGAGSVQGFHALDDPEAKLASTALTVTPAGALTLKVTCPAGEASCGGIVTLRTLTAVGASAHGRKVILTLASGSFTVVGGQVKVVTLHLVSKARALLARLHVLRVRATLVAHDPAGVSKTTQAVVTLRLAKPAHARKH